MLSLPFADKLGRLANNFEDKAILALVEEYTDRRKIYAYQQ